jgi:Na+/H+ antiporter NhaD/arsenite permease-like protein
LLAKITGDPKYEENPLVVNYDVPVGISFNEFMIYFVLPIIVAITVVGLIYYYIYRKSARKIKQ